VIAAPNQGIFCFRIFLDVGDIALAQPGASAIWLGSNSTGGVIKEKTTVRANKAIPTKRRLEFPEAAINTPISKTQFTMVELN
jgi:hypothetical protein